MTWAIIPDAVHICPACGDIASGGTLCGTCTRADSLEARAHAGRANAVFSQQPRTTGRMPEDPRLTPLTPAEVLKLSAWLICFLYAWAWIGYEVYRGVTR